MASQPKPTGPVSRLRSLRQSVNSRHQEREVAVAAEVAKLLAAYSFPASNTAIERKPTSRLAEKMAKIKMIVDIVIKSPSARDESVKREALKTVNEFKDFFGDAMRPRSIPTLEVPSDRVSFASSDGYSEREEDSESSTSHDGLDGMPFTLSAIGQKTCFENPTNLAHLKAEAEAKAAEAKAAAEKILPVFNSVNMTARPKHVFSPLASSNRSENHERPLPFTLPTTFRTNMHSYYSPERHAPHQEATERQTQFGDTHEGPFELEAPSSLSLPMIPERSTRRHFPIAPLGSSPPSVMLTDPLWGAEPPNQYATPSSAILTDPLWGVEPPNPSATPSSSKPTHPSWGAY